MTDKEKLIIDYLKTKRGKAYYIDIRDKVGIEFDSESDFDVNIKTLTSKNWICENDNDTLYLLNNNMNKAIEFSTLLDKFEIKSTGSDGGHKYISTEINYKGIKRKMTVLFYNKQDENILVGNTKIKIHGDLIDEGLDYNLTLYNALIIK